MEKLIATLFMAREVTHRLHLGTKKYAHHMALGDFYEEIIELADELAEVNQGKYGLMIVPFLNYEGPMDDIKGVEYLQEAFRKARVAGVKSTDTDLQNICDEINALFSRTLYKLKNLA